MCSEDALARLLAPLRDKRRLDFVGRFLRGLILEGVIFVRFESSDAADLCHV